MICDPPPPPPRKTNILEPPKLEGLVQMIFPFTVGDFFSGSMVVFEGSIDVDDDFGS